MITWVIVISLSVLIPDKGVWSAPKWTDRFQFVSEQACKDYKRSDIFLDRSLELKASALKLIGNPHAAVDVDSTCAALGDPA